MTMLDTITLLGRPVRGSINASQLEAFPAPDGVSLVTYASEELTSTCPMTGQPDLYNFTFAYRPGRLCVESKALKLYLHSFRNEGVFCEALAARILADLVEAIEPTAATVLLKQRVRGGLSLSARADHQGGAL